jgi:hypothetical protein
MLLRGAWQEINSTPPAGYHDLRLIVPAFFFFIFVMRHGWRPSPKGFSTSGDDPIVDLALMAKNVKETVISGENY